MSGQAAVEIRSTQIPLDDKFCKMFNIEADENVTGRKGKFLYFMFNIIPGWSLQSSSGADTKLDIDVFVAPIDIRGRATTQDLEYSNACHFTTSHEFFRHNLRKFVSMAFVGMINTKFMGLLEIVEVKIRQCEMIVSVLNHTRVSDMLKVIFITISTGELLLTLAVHSQNHALTNLGGYCIPGTLHPWEYYTEYQTCPLKLPYFIVTDDESSRRYLDGDVLSVFQLGHIEVCSRRYELVEGAKRYLVSNILESDVVDRVNVLIKACEASPFHQTFVSALPVQPKPQPQPQPVFDTGNPAFMDIVNGNPPTHDDVLRAADTVTDSKSESLECTECFGFLLDASPGESAFSFPDDCSGYFSTAGPE